MDLTIKEVAKQFNCSESGVRGMIYHRKVFPFHKLGGKVMIKQSDIDLYKESQKTVKRNQIFKTFDFNTVVDEWLNLYKQGKSFKEISDIYNCDSKSVGWRLRKAFPDFEFDIYQVKLTDEEKITFSKAIDYYYSDNNISMEMIYLKFGITPSRFRVYMKRISKHIKGRGIVGSLCTNHNYFRDIDTEDKAYLLGFFSADGHLEFKGNSYCIKIGVQIKDSHILSLYNKFLCSGKATIRVVKNLSMAEISIGSLDLGKQLRELGFDNNKTYNWKSLPIIPTEMYPHFIRGFFDGDGSIMVDRRIEGKRLNGYNKKFNIVCFNKSILEEIAVIMNLSNYDLLKREPTATSVKGHYANFKTCWYLECNSTEELVKIHKFLYTNAKYFFKRKKDKFDLAILYSNEIEAALQGNL